MKHFSSYLTVLGLSLATVFSCTNPIDTGSDLLDEDLVNIQAVDTFKIITTAVPGDSLLVYSIPTNSSSGFISRYFLGKMNDPIMGLTDVAIQTQLVPAVQIHPGLGITVDSMVLVLPYSTANIYGDKAQRYDLEIRELADSFALDKNYYSNQKLPVSAEVLQAQSFAVNFDSIKIKEYSSSTGTETKVPPQLRIRLNNTKFQTKLLGIDTAVYKNRVKFIKEFYGLQLNATNLGKALAAFDLSSTRAGLYLYYKTAAGTATEYRYVFGFVAANSISRDRGTSLLGKYLAGEPNQEYILLQGQEGANSKFSIPSLKNLKNVIINKAELVLNVANVPGDESVFFTPSPRILAMYRNDKGQLTVVEDFNNASQAGNLDPFYGGAYVSGTNNEPGSYTINLSAHVQNMIKGKVPNEIYLKAFPLAESAARTTLYRADHPLYGAKLKLYYTQLGQ
ncbi:MAG: DUF4270 family protein [Haliscomenobacter sp.]|uniref:DUF4270 family protein n=1 Tax=Haliscomenobacter sp. TaxID=2717303 RepID=UPI0029BA4E0D|nr:DUF4270 family protein [Haliscomenobacter sp.]MDX2069952.1 DUF4270 family protein [Haliscomenobacter sp.]